VRLSIELLISAAARVFFSPGHFTPTSNRCGETSRITREMGGLLREMSTFEQSLVSEHSCLTVCVVFNIFHIPFHKRGSGAGIRLSCFVYCIPFP
jgi:hypothetical protein